MPPKLIRAAAVVPVVVASAVWSAHLVAPGAPAAAPTPLTDSAADVASSEPTLPEGRLVPERAFELPASTSRADGASSASVGRFSVISTSPSAGDIPAVSLAAYQRAESLIGTADASCNLPWQLVAAIGRVESDHGRFDGAKVGANGVSRPAIIGPVLDGSAGTAVIRDTDAGDLDGDLAYDRAVGPMQFIPSTWAVVGVDGDADGVRDPQDIDDAALAAAVYLCSGTEDLALERGLREAIFRYNRSVAYVDQVVSLTEDYLAGNDIVPVQSVVNAGLITPLVPLSEQPPGYVAPAVGVPGGSVAPAPTATGTAAGDAAPATLGDGEASYDGFTPPAVGEPAEPTEPTEPTDPTEPTPAPTPTPTPAPSPAPTPAPSPTPAPTPAPESAPSHSDAAAEYCASEGLVDDPATGDDDFDACATSYDLEGPPEEPDPTPAPVNARPEETAALPVD